MNSWKNHQVGFDRLDKNSIVVDAGACRGTFIDFIRNKIDCKIYAIEPCKSNFEFLQNKGYTNVDLFNAALVGETASQYINFKEYVGLPEWGSIYDKKLAYKHPKFKSELQYEVETIKMGNIFEVFNIDHIDYLKLDIEGAEFDVFHSIDIDMASKIYQFSAEVHTKNNTDVMALILYLEDLDYTCKWFADKLEVWGVRNDT